MRMILRKKQESSELSVDELIRQIRRLRVGCAITLIGCVWLIFLRIAIGHPAFGGPTGGWLDVIHLGVLSVIVGAEASLVYRQTWKLHQLHFAKMQTELAHDLMKNFVQMTGGVTISIVTEDDASDLPPDVVPGHPLFEVVTEAMEHGRGVCAHLVRGDDGWEVLRAHFEDGTEFGPHEPAHEERK